MGNSETRSAAADPIIAISSRAVEMAIEKGIAMGVQAAMDYLEEEDKKQQDRRLHNTKLLLKKYRHLKKHVAGAIDNVKVAKESAHEILRSGAGMNDRTYVEGIKKSRERTFIVIQHIDQALRYYRIDCQESGKPEHMRRYRVIMAMYINDEKKTASQIAEEEHIEETTVYKDIRKAINPLSTLIFGIDSVRLR